MYFQYQVIRHSNIWDRPFLVNDQVIAGLTSIQG